jgi:hypothetical protein
VSGKATNRGLNVGTCPTCGKQSFPSKSAAKRVARQQIHRGQGHLNAYRCGGYWHLGNLPSVVVRGAAPRTGAEWVRRGQGA